MCRGRVRRLGTRPCRDGRRRPALDRRAASIGLGAAGPGKDPCRRPGADKPRAGGPDSAGATRRGIRAGCGRRGAFVCWAGGLDTAGPGLSGPRALSCHGGDGKGAARRRATAPMPGTGLDRPARRV